MGPVSQELEGNQGAYADAVHRAERQGSLELQPLSAGVFLLEKERQVRRQRNRRGDRDSTGQGGRLMVVPSTQGSKLRF